jgi:hypothetical protein
MTDVTLEKGNNSLFTKWFKKEKILPDNDINDQAQLDIKSIEEKLGW